MSFEQGNIRATTGEHYQDTNTARIRMSLYVRPYGVGLKIKIRAGYKALGFKYSDATTSAYLGTLNNGYFMRGEWFFDDDVFYRFVLCKEDDQASISPSEGSNIVFTRLYANKYSAVCDIENGGLYAGYGSTGNGYDLRYSNRRTDKLIEGSARAQVYFNSSDVPYIEGVSVWKYGILDGNVVFNERLDVTLFDNYIFVTLSDEDKYFKLNIRVLNGGLQHRFHSVFITSENPIVIHNNPNLYHTQNKVINLLYTVSGDTLTAGSLMLPPNYSIDGKPVPLHVYCHGTGGMEKWDSNVTMMGDIDLSEIFNYYLNEGFAVFDCYPWTDKYYSSSRQISPFMLQVNEKSYIEGIKYVCSHFNVDIENVCVSGLSLGGNMATWFSTQTEIPVRAIGMMAPTTGWASQRWKDYFLEKSARSVIIHILGLENETGVSTFINTNNGMKNNTVNQFVSDHIDSFVGLSPAALGITGSTYKDQIEYMLEMERTEPQWMVDEGIPEIPTGWLTNTYGDTIGIPALVNHPELAKYSPYPIKFWQAFDDVNVSGHANYTIYTWLKNGGSQVYWRTLENGHGGHGATGYRELAEKTNGETRLGITYTNVPVAQVELIDFFYKNIVQ